MQPKIYKDTRYYFRQTDEYMGNCHSKILNGVKLMPGDNVSPEYFGVSLGKHPIRNRFVISREIISENGNESEKVEFCISRIPNAASCWVEVTPQRSFDEVKNILERVWYL